MVRGLASGTVLGQDWYQPHPLLDSSIKQNGNFPILNKLRTKKVSCDEQNCNGGLRERRDNGGFPFFAGTNLLVRPDLDSRRMLQWRQMDF
jgi:hypothetical protein